VPAPPLGVPALLGLVPAAPAVELVVPPDAPPPLLLQPMKSAPLNRASRRDDIFGLITSFALFGILLEGQRVQGAK
jgi:hypothetical protein